MTPSGIAYLGTWDFRKQRGADPVTIARRDAATRALAPQALAQARSTALAETAQELAEQRESAALESRTKELDAAVAKINQQSKLLTDQSSFLMPTAGGFDTRFGPRLHPILRYYKLHNGDDIGGDFVVQRGRR